MKYTYWQDKDMWLGYLNEYPDYMTQGETIDELKENLIDVYKENCHFDQREKSLAAPRFLPLVEMTKTFSLWAA